MSHAHTEDQLVEQPAIVLFAELAWSTVSAKDVIPAQARDLLLPRPPSGRISLDSEALRAA